MTERALWVPRAHGGEAPDRDEEEGRHHPGAQEMSEPPRGHLESRAMRLLLLLRGVRAQRDHRLG